MSFYLDNRTTADVHDWNESRIEALKRRVDELEKELAEEIAHHEMELAARDHEIWSLHNVIKAMRDDAVTLLKGECS